ncbi:MAG TPA: trypsin-like peptidase domain-containing protein [Pyrinomonadaceae bacterium]
MAGGLVVHISNGQERHTEVLSQERVLIGPGEACHIRLGSDLLTDSSVMLELTRHNGHFRVQEFDPEIGITLNGRPLARGAKIDDGDELRFSAFDVRMQFFPVGNLPAVSNANRRASVAPFIEQAAIEAAATARRDDAKVFLREFTRELLREINWSTKIGVFLCATILIGGVLYLGYALQQELRRSRDLINKQNEQLAAQQRQLELVGAQFGEVDERNREIINSLSLAPRLRSEYGNGVCLVAGSYMLFEPGTGRPFRYPETQTNESGENVQSAGEQPLLTAEGNGPPFIRDFVGTCFHVGQGFVVTNRHLAVEPWTADEGVQTLSQSVQGQFRVTRIVAFFPGIRQPFVVRVRHASREDVAVGTLEVKELPAQLPALPLDPDPNTAMIGGTVVMMGYPSGEDRLMATIPEAEARTLRERCGASAETLLACLSDRSYIKPLTTQGHISDLQGRNIVYDARNAVGGSGSPLFGPKGRVIGVNFATFTEMEGQNYAVPVKYVFPLLERAGWKSAEPSEEQNANANTAPPATATRPPAEQKR